MLTIVKVEVKGNTEWRCFRARGGSWVAVCDPLGLTIQGETWAAMTESIAETLNAMLTDLITSKELERFLRDRGWQITGPLPSPPADLWFDVPFTTRTADRDSEAALR